ncbi:hypothetical protein BS50DRAFT_413772 [Corynespora cassiicola Philippines]|uniref:Uncharacterized protein n=1 Tax=Corynespora cassiicola Philippines TaxID=1448308 RepID=A0A2T2NM91_CORCC|nr:hypothetical protein BS50DRAFT_413772 [Corynespora cassiicola Philippines]
MASATGPGSATDAGSPSSRLRRVKLTSDTPSATSDRPVSDQSGQIPKSTPGGDVDMDSESELSTSSEEPSSESGSEDEDESDGDGQGADGVVNLRANRGIKPTFKLDRDELGPDIRPFLKDFLPKLKAANEELEAARKAGTLKDRAIERTDEDGVEGGDEQYIEMNLGLGVLKEKDPNAADDSASDSDSEPDDGTGDKDVLDKLMRREKKAKATNGAIQDLGAAQDT